MPTIRINDTDHEVPAEVAAHVADLSRRADGGSLDPQRVAERAQLVQVAARVLGQEERLDSLADRELRERVIASLAPERRVDASMSDDYVHGTLDALVVMRQSEGPVAVRRNDGLSLVQACIESGQRRRADSLHVGDPVQARLDALEAKFDGPGAQPEQDR